MHVKRYNRCNIINDKEGYTMRTIIWFIYFAVYFICLTPYMFYIKHLIKTGQEEKAEEKMNPVVIKWASRLMRLAGVKVHVQGKENIPEGGPCVFVSNHQGNFDIPVLLTSLDKPHGFIAKVETKKIPLVSTWMQFLHCLFLDRKDARSAVASLNGGIETLKEGHSLIIFPEGTRSRGTEMGEFKLGAFSIAAKAKVPVVPIRLEGSYKAMEANNMFIKPADVYVKILPAIATEGRTKAELKEMGDAVYDLIKNTDATAS